MTLEEAITKYGALAQSDCNTKPGTAMHKVACGGYGLADLMGFPDGANVDEHADWICFLFGQEAFGGSIRGAFERGKLRIGGEVVTPQTATGIVVER